MTTKKPKKKLLDLNPEFVAKVGEEKIAVFEEHVIKVVEDFDQAFITAVSEATRKGRELFTGVLAMPNYAEHQGALMSAARDLVLDRFMCTLITYVAEVAIDLGHPPSELVHHLLTHMETAQRHNANDTLARGLLPVLRSLVPSDLQSLLADLQKKDTPPPFGG